MNLGKLGVWYAADKLTPVQWRRFVQKVESLNYGTLWYSEARGFESMALGSFLLAQTKTICIGSSIANIYARDAYASRQGLHTLSAVSDNRFVLGLGVSHVPLVEQVRGHTYTKPLATMRTYLEKLYSEAADGLTWPVVLAALGPRMLALSAELTRGAIPYNVTPEHTASAKSILGADKWLAVEQKACLECGVTKIRSSDDWMNTSMLAPPMYASSQSIARMTWIQPKEHWRRLHPVSPADKIFSKCARKNLQTHQPV